MSKPSQTAENKTTPQHKPKPAPQVAVPQAGAVDLLTEAPVLSTAGSLAEQTAMLKRLPTAQQQTMMSKIGQTQGNAHVQRLVASLRPPTVKHSTPSPTLQPKMEVNEPDDQYEQEADQVADAVMRMPTAAPTLPPDDELPPSEGANGNGAGSFVQAKGNGSGEVAPETAARIQGLRGGGSPLPEGERRFFEERMGADFSDVRIHTSSNAAQASQEVQAKAFTTGNDIAFNEGEYQPGTESGRHLLAHELTHTIQQGAASTLQREVIQRRKSPTEPSNLENAPEPTEEDKAAAEAAAQNAKAQAGSEKNQSLAEKSSKLAESAAEKSKGAAAQEKVKDAKAQGPLAEKSAAKEGAGAPSKKGPGAEKEGKGAQEKSGTTVTAFKEKGAANQPKPPLPAAEKAVGTEVAPTGVGLEGATAAAQDKVAQAMEQAEEAPDKAPESAEADSGFTAAQSTSKAVGKQQQAHPEAQSEAAEAQTAAVQPAAEVTGLAQAGQVGKMEQAETPEFNKAAFKQALMERIEALTPKTVEDADNFKADGKLDGVKEDVQGKVGEQKAQSQQPLEQTRKAAPDTGSVPPKPTESLTPNQPGEPPAGVGAEAAMPKPKGQGEVEKPLQESGQAMDQQMADAEITEEQLANSNEPEFTGALEEKKAAKQQIAEAPAQYRQEEQAQLQNAEQAAVAVAQNKVQEMHSTRSSSLAQSDAQQTQAKSADEQKRAEVAAEINKIYAETQQEVEGILAGLDGKVMAEFDAGAAKAKQTFENYVEREMDAYKEDRYGGWFGWARWAKDKLFGMPSEVNAFYTAGRQLYVNEMDAVIDKVASIITTTLTEAKAAVAKGKQRIQEYVQKLPQDLQKVGQEAAQEIQSKFDDLEQQIKDKQGELIETLAQKYQENLQAVDARIEELKAANKGLVDKVIDAVAGVIKTILKLKDMLLNVLARVAEVVGHIISDPIGFLGNLLDAIKQGFNGFIDNIGTHLKKGLITWLTGSLANAGLTLPENFDLPGIFQLVLQILGVSFEQIMGKISKVLGFDIMAVIEPIKQLIGIYQEEGLAGLAKYGLTKLIGEENMGHLMKVWEIIQVVQTGGFGALWGIVSEYLTDLKETVMNAIEDLIAEKVIKAGISWLLGLFSPVGAFIKACKMIYDVVMFFVNNGSRIMELVESIISSVSNIARGNISAAAKFIEETLARMIPLAISFLSSLLGLGDISGQVRDIIKKVHTKVDQAIDKVLNSKPVQAVAGFIKKAVGKVKGLAQAGINKVKGVIGLGDNNNSAKEKAKKRVQEETKQPFASEKDLKVKIATIEGELRPEGLNSLTIKQKSEQGQYDVIAREVNKDDSKPVDAGDAIVGQNGSSADLGFAVGTKIHYREREGSGVTWDLATVVTINETDSTVTLNVEKQRSNAAEKNVTVTKPFAHFIKGKTWKDEGEGSEEETRVKEAIAQAGGIVQLMRALSTSGATEKITRQELAKLWDENQSVRDLVKNRFRSANSGSHEWITCEMIIQVLDRTAGAEFGAEMINWVDLQHSLRTDTSWVIFSPDYSLSQSTDIHEGGPGYDLMHGHPGALYINRVNPESGNTELVSLSQMHTTWNNELARKFNDIKRVSLFVQSLRTFFGYTVWDGKSAPAKLSPYLRDSGGNILSRSTLTAQQSARFEEIQNVFARFM